MKIMPFRRLRRIATVAIGLLGPRPAFGQGWEVPKPAVDLKPGTANYRITLEARGQTSTVHLSRTIKSLNGNWLVTNTTTRPGHVQTDESIVEKRTLIIRKRTFRDGRASADLAFAGTRITGTIEDASGKSSIDNDAGGVIFADGSAAEVVLAALPLASNYSVEFRNFNIGSQLVKTLHLRVMDSETVTVPAGTFDTWRVIITPINGASDSFGLWVDKRSHLVVKEMVSIPNLGDAIATEELESVSAR
jgi:hypothetical protein